MNPAPSRIPYGTTAGLWPTIGTIPKSNAGTGVISHQANSVVVTGVGTAFLTQVKPGDYIFVPSVPQIYKVFIVDSNTQLRVDKAFATVLAGVAFQITQPGCRAVTIKNIGGANGTLMNNTIEPQDEVNYDRVISGERATVPVLFYDATGTEFSIKTL